MVTPKNIITNKCSWTDAATNTATLAEDVKVVAVDAAGNTYELNVEDFLVSTNIFVRWYNNTPLFIGSIVGVVLLGVGITIFILFGKKKKEEE